MHWNKSKYTLKSFGAEDTSNIPSIFFYLSHYDKLSTTTMRIIIFHFFSNKDLIFEKTTEKNFNLVSCYFCFPIVLYLNLQFGSCTIYYFSWSGKNMSPIVRFLENVQSKQSSQKFRCNVKAKEESDYMLHTCKRNCIKHQVYNLLNFVA